jgi:hypothetical protein
MKWRKSSYSGQSGGNCIEVADQGNRVLVRDSKNRVGAMLRFTPDAWRRFADQVKGERSLASDSPSASGGGALSCLGALPLPVPLKLTKLDFLDKFGMLPRSSADFRWARSLSRLSMLMARTTCFPVARSVARNPRGRALGSMSSAGYGAFSLVSFRRSRKRRQADLTRGSEARSTPTGR